MPPLPPELPLDLPLFPFVDLAVRVVACLLLGALPLVIGGWGRPRDAAGLKGAGDDPAPSAARATSTAPESHASDGDTKRACGAAARSALASAGSTIGSSS